MINPPETTSPATLEEWQSYIQTLEGSDLRSKAIAANSRGFLDALQQDGFLPQESTAILRMFAGRLIQTNQEPPGGGYVEYFDLIMNDDGLRPAYQAMASSPF